MGEAERGYVGSQVEHGIWERGAWLDQGSHQETSQRSKAEIYRQDEPHREEPHWSPQIRNASSSASSVPYPEERSYYPPRQHDCRDTPTSVTASACAADDPSIALRRL